MNVWFLLLTTGVLIGVLVLNVWLTDPGRVERRFMKRMIKSFETFNVTVGTALIPAFEEATKAIDDFAVSYAAASAEAKNRSPVKVSR